MKLIQTSSPLITSENLTSSKMEIAEEAHDMISVFLRDKIYTDKVGAVVREYICNAVDEHIKYEMDRPVVVALKRDEDSFNYKLLIRDYAKGLDDYSIRNIFGMYGCSTKRDNNNQSGAYGIGAKSFACYTDTFYVISYFSGEKTTYTCVLGGDKGISKGHIYELGREPSSETGLEIRVPVKECDFYNFHSKIMDFVAISPYNIEYYVDLEDGCEKFVPCPTIMRKQLISGADTYEARIINVEEFNSHQYGNRNLDGGTSVSHILMGGVKYAGGSLLNCRLKKNTVLLIDVPIGTMSLPISREAFEETPSNTTHKQNIRNLVNNFAKKDVEASVANLTIEDWAEKGVVNKTGSSLAYNYLEGDYFTSQVIDWIPNEISKFLNNLGYVQHGDDFDIENIMGYHVIVKTYSPLKCPASNKIILVDTEGRNKRQLSYWKKKLRLYLSMENCGAFMTDAAKYASDPSLKIQDYFKIVGIDKLPYPKTITQSRPKGKFAIYDKYNDKIDTFSPLEFAQYFMHKNFNGLFSKDQKSCEKKIKELKSGIETFENLRALTIRLRGQGGSSFNSSKSFVSYHIAASTMTNSLINDFGFVQYKSPEWRTLYDMCSKKAEEKRLLEEAKTKISSFWAPINPRLICFLASKPDKAKRVIDAWENAANKESFSGKILKIHRNTHHKFSRQEIRQATRLEKF